jgi:integrase
MATVEARAPKARAGKGAVIRAENKRGAVTFALRFTAYGQRRYVTLGTAEEGWTGARASDELAAVLAAVRAGTWTPWEPTAPVEPEPEPTFHEFASKWFEETRAEWREATVLDYEWQLRCHLLPFFGGHRLSEITVAEVDRYRTEKLRRNRELERAAAAGKPITITFSDVRGRILTRPERPLSVTSINKTITRLGQVLEVAVERDRIARNPTKINSRRRKLRAVRPPRTYLDRSEQIAALLDAAGELDRGARSNSRVARRALLSTLAFAGLRIGEALALRWRDVDLAGGRLRVRQSKTDAGVRCVDLLPVLRDELAAYKARANAEPDALVFSTSTGAPLGKDNARNRVLAPAVKLAAQRIETAGTVPLPEGLTLHSLRRTYCSVLAGIGKDPAYVMKQMGHTSAALTLSVYQQPWPEDDRPRLRALVGDESVPAVGTSKTRA